MKNRMNKIYTNIYTSTIYTNKDLSVQVLIRFARIQNYITLYICEYMYIYVCIYVCILINLIKVRVSLYFPPILLRFLCFSFAIYGTYVMSIIREFKNVSFSIYT